MLASYFPVPFVSSNGFEVRRVLSSDGTEDDLEVLELEQVFISIQGQGQIRS